MFTLLGCPGVNRTLTREKTFIFMCLFWEALGLRWMPPPYSLCGCFREFFTPERWTNGLEGFGLRAWLLCRRRLNCEAWSMLSTAIIRASLSCHGRLEVGEWFLSRLGVLAFAVSCWSPQGVSVSQGSVNGGFQTVVRVCGDQIPLHPFDLNFTPFLTFCLVLTSF